MEEGMSRFFIGGIDYFIIVILNILIGLFRKRLFW